jgi:hypothetical protein
MSRIQISTDTTLTIQSMAVPQQEFSKSIFSASHLHPGNFQTKNIRQNQPEWIPLLLLFCILLITWTRVFYPKRMQQIYKASFSNRFIKQLVRDGDLFKERISLALGMVFVVTFSLLIYEFNRQILGLTFPHITGVGLFVLIMAAVLLYQTVKVALIQMLGIIFKTKETTYGYLLNILIFTLFSGPVLLVANILFLYLNSVFLLYFSLIIFMVFFTFRFVKGFFIGTALTKFSYLFLFVYLCSLEILPLLIIIKLLLIHMKSLGG